MRGKLLSLFIPVLAVSAIVGTGFALFEFNESEATSLEINNSNVDLAGYSEIAMITIENETYARLSIDSAADEGIHLIYDSGATGASQDRVFFHFALIQDTAAEESLTLTTVINMSSDLGAYFSLSAQTYLRETAIGSKIRKEHMYDSLTLTDTLTHDGSSAGTSFTLYTYLTFDWADDREPTTRAEWDTLNKIINDISGAAFAITYTVDFA